MSDITFTGMNRLADVSGQYNQSTQEAGGVRPESVITTDGHELRTGVGAEQLARMATYFRKFGNKFNRLGDKAVLSGKHEARALSGEELAHLPAGLKKFLSRQKGA
jgi:hypothetical protein